ncbi:inverse autotransporter beta domain-containing protein [Enterobacter hormaechei]|uniref:inverse autotransporter beta domain-containing protein n=1 Tax=Enterobacter hormaechei TaxID=158836 RepID=UPI000649BF5B|nr:inverse autotransporter beta domain-containing protein [Enterobacter hormaechei]KLP69214.1 invasin [Enterobacter hormaechei subsp. steigerwaltii]
MKRSHFSHPPADVAFSSVLRRLVWLNIAVQTAFPLAIAFTPVMAGAGEQHFLQQPVPLSAQRTQVYTLSSGETAASVAIKFHLTLDQLRELNQLRTFAHGLNGLRPGDDVDVPLMTVKGNKSSTDAPSSDRSASAKKGDEQAQKVAGYATQAGGVLAGSAKSDAAASMARSMATGEAGGALQQWLSHFGTARVQLDAYKDFSLKNSQFDLLMPLYDRGDNLVFTQGSLHRTDSRTQANLGAGLRHFTPTYMLGGNLFGDYDLSRDHARAGAGIEYWRNFLKLGANGYMRLTGWKDSPDLTDYQERPANGWDIRAQAWVPSLPQLGGKLTYEQYYGKEVALFGVDSRQNNPHAITAGINYTPVPLITLGAEQRQGQSGESDTRITVDMKYQPGVPWRNQVDPTAVAAMRSLIGSRYDLVERNNNIVLEYRKKDTIRLHTADLVTGHAGEQKSLGVSVTSTYGLSRIDWDAQALAAAGGKIVQNGSDYAVVLPAYQSSAQGVNTYTVSGVAVDRKGNRSDRSDTQVTVQSPEVNKQASTFTPVSSLLPADGRSAQALTLTLRDGNNQAVDMDVKDISLNSSALKSATVSALTRKSAGVYTLTVTAGTDAERVTLTPSVSGITLSPAEVTISSVTPDAGQSQFSASPETIAADNTTFSTLTLVAKDTQGNALAGLKNSLTFTVKDSSGKAAGDTITESAIAESSTKGTYTATLKGTAPGKYIIAPEYNGTAMGSLSATVTLKTTAPVQAQSAISTDKTSYVSGTDMVVKVTLKDAAGDAVTGATASLTTDTVKVANATLKTGSSWKDNGDGTYTATYTAGAAGDSLKATVQLTDWGSSADSNAYAITFGDEAPQSINTQVNSHTFTVSGEEGAFPSTGFVGATFTIVPKNGAAGSEYVWKTDASWISVTDGVVRFTGKGSGDKVTITGTPVNGRGNLIKYSFTLKNWFISNTVGSNWGDANSFCNSNSGYNLADVSIVSTKSRETGALWSEWGNLSNYSGGTIPAANLWTSSLAVSDLYYYVTSTIGGVYSGSTSNKFTAICNNNL